MAGNFGHHVTPGQPFRPRASEWNNLLDVARTVGDGRPITRVPPAEWFPSKGASARVIFTILFYDDYTGIATCGVTHTLCSGDIPDHEVIEGVTVIYVEDPTGCFFSGEDSTSLPNRKGWADYVVSLSDPYEACFWAVSNLCCQESG